MKIRFLCESDIGRAFQGEPPLYASSISTTDPTDKNTIQRCVQEMMNSHYGFVRFSGPDEEEAFLSELHRSAYSDVLIWWMGDECVFFPHIKLGEQARLSAFGIDSDDEEPTLYLSDNMVMVDLFRNGKPTNYPVFREVRWLPQRGHGIIELGGKSPHHMLELLNELSAGLCTGAICGNESGGILHFWREDDFPKPESNGSPFQLPPHEYNPTNTTLNFGI